ncbi:variant erythrocyte surface antigen-1 family protein [Babesia caballi]|uniref:Variant erythrocyte surface antigen-1 family protein n=1 Tax=Babesia caballi TaxID=5871 RepID=A0AAV4LMY5_BABCB|nr:variant erythrocyte surface antigen-1 family protein [Babesia caballi]
MTSGGKSLTETPEDLKEAIDWVFRINELDKINDLAAALEALLKEDAGLVIWEVREVFDVIKDNIIEQFDKMNGPFCDHYKSHLRSATEGLKDVKRPDDAKKEDLTNAIEALVKGLKTFLGYNGGVSTKFSGNGIISNVSSGYTFTYNNAAWDPADAPKCATIFLGILPVIFFGVTLMYWKCSEKNGWQNSELKNASNGPLKQFLTQMGFSGVKFNDGKKASQVVGDLNSGFTELSTSNAKSNDYPNFLGKLQETALKSSTTSPLTSLYLIGYYYITYPLYDFQSTSPGTPSFLGYSGTAALAGGAYGFNLGGLGTFMSALLA